MTTTFEIVFRRKIPYWSSFLFALMGTFATFLFILYLAMSPTEHASGEMKVAYYILVIPEWLKQASSYSFLGLMALLPIYSYSKRYRNGQVSFHENAITVSEETDKVILIESINKVVINDVRSIFRKERAEVLLKQGNLVRASFLLKHYIQSEELIDALSIYPNVEFVFSNEIPLQNFDQD